MLFIILKKGQKKIHHFIHLKFAYFSPRSIGLVIPGMSDVYSLFSADQLSFVLSSSYLTFYPLPSTCPPLKDFLSM